jgi:hypothetical protein
MHLFSKKSKSSLFKADIFEDIPSPKDGELVAIPIDNELWHPLIAIYANNRKTPEWYKNVLAGDMGLRGCYGLGDYMRMGYTIPLWANLEVRQPISKLQSKWSARYTTAPSESTANALFHNNPPEFMDKHYILSSEVIEREQFAHGQTGKCPIQDVQGRPKGDYLKLINPWLIKTAPGWSCLFIQPQWEPSNDYDILAGVVNTDSYHHCNVVFNIRSATGFNMEAGTPLLHVIPFKRAQVIKKSSLIKGHEGAYKLLEGLGFDTVFRDERWEGKYKREQHKIDKSLE